MKVHFITIVLNGMPFITWHYPTFRQLPFDWHWWVVEGVAAPKGCTKWCANLFPGVSTDRTYEYLLHLAKFDKRVTHLYQYASAWPGKAAMFNEALSQITDEHFLLWQVDSDEIWTARQIERMRLWILSDPRNCAYFHCRYFVGPSLVVTSRNGFGNNDAYEWKRLWKVKKGARFKTHEPPVLENFKEYPIEQESTEYQDCVFDHFAYATEAQMRFKSIYYSGDGNPKRELYKNAVEGWKRLQDAPMPVLQLKEYLPWVGDNVTVDRVKI